MPDYPGVLVAPDGREVTPTSPAEYNDLRYGLGYQPKPPVTPPPPPPKRPKSDAK